MKTPEMIVVEHMLRGLALAQLSEDPGVRAAASSEAAALNKRLAKLNTQQAGARSIMEGSQAA